jgi:hypothetical protein
MARKVTVEVKISLTILAEENVDISNLLNELDYNFIVDEDYDAEIINNEMIDFEITDSK